jgi:probable HAF family extracellular repeat protein
VALPTRIPAQEKKEDSRHFKLIDLGTLGGPHSYGSAEGLSLLNNSGIVASFADLAVPDPNQAYFCFVPDCFQAHAAQWKDGVITDLGALPGNNNSLAGSINARGWVTGQSQSSTIDPIIGIPEFRGALWKDGQVIDLGTLEAGTESLGIYVTDGGRVIGFSTISTESDPLGFFGFPTHTFIWEKGNKEDIGTLGGSDTFPGAGCSHPPEGFLVGGSSTSTILNPDTGLPTFDPFLRHLGKMIDLGTLGGTFGSAQCVNGRGQVIGQSSLAENPAACSPPIILGIPPTPGCHAFFWQEGVMTDLGTLGGGTSEAIWLNESGDVAGSADLSTTGIHHAVLWKKGKQHDLGTVPGDPCSRGRGLNARGQVVGGSSDCTNFLHAFLWEEDGPMIDLNTLISAGSGFQLTNAFNINDRGEILAKAAPLGFTPNDDADLGHLVLLIPCEGDEDGECKAVEESAGSLAPRISAPILKSSTTAALPQRPLTPGENGAAWRARLARRYHLLGSPAEKSSSSER